MNSAPLLVWFADIDLEDTSYVGKEGKKLGAMAQAGFPIPPGFVITASAYHAYLKDNKLDDRIKKLLTTVNYELPESIMQVTNHLKKMFFDARFSDTFLDQLDSYEQRLSIFPLHINAFSLTKDNPKHISHKAESSDELRAKIKNAWAEHFAANLLAHRQEHNIDHIETGTAIVIQAVIDPEKKGIVTTIHPHSHAKDILHIRHQFTHGSDTYELSKKTLSILDRALTQHIAPTMKLTHDELLQIADMAREMEKHHFFPQEIHWGIIGEQVFILETKPYTHLPKAKPEKVKKHTLARGYGVTKTIGSGVVKIIHDAKDFQQTNHTHILVLHEMKLENLKHLKKAKGIIAESGERHAEINVHLRNHAIPTLINVKFATQGLKNGQLITIHAGKGEIYSGGF